MFTILSSRQNKKETILSIGYTTDKNEAKVFNKCLSNGLGIKYKKGGRKWNSRKQNENKVS